MDERIKKELLGKFINFHHKKAYFSMNENLWKLYPLGCFNQCEAYSKFAFNIC